MTLKENYDHRRLTSLQKRLQKIDNKLVTESLVTYGPRDILLLEALDQKQLEVAYDIIKKLNATDFAPIEAFNTVKKVVLDDVKKVLGGKNPLQAIAGFFKKLVNQDGEVNDDPLSTALAFVDSTRNFFDDIVKLIDAMQMSDENKSIKENLSTKSQKETQKQIQLMSNIIKKSLRPDFDASKLGQSWVHKYLPGLLGGKGLKTIIKGVLDASPAQLRALQQQVSKNFSNAASQGNAIAAAVRKGSETTQPEHAESSTSATPTTGTEKPTPSTMGAPKTIAKVEEKDVKDIASRLASRYPSKIDANTAETVINALLSQKFSISK